MSPASISVALATYNGERFVEEQLRSILAQDPRPTEIVVADDGSTDDTLEIVARIAAEVPGVVRVLEPGARLGVAANFARAIAACTGELIALSDQDDVWHSSRLTGLSRALDEQPGRLLVHSDARIVDARGVPSGATLFGLLEIAEADLLAEEAGDGFDVLLRRNLVTGATTLLRTELREAALPIPPGWLHDEWLAVIAAATGGVSVVRDALTDYRQHGANEVGVTRRTLRHKIDRVLSPRGDRIVGLASRTQSLVERLTALEVAPHRIEAARHKLRVETRRAGLPRVRLLRLPGVLGLLLRGDYARYTSQGNAEVLRDLLQPA